MRAHAILPAPALRQARLQLIEQGDTHGHGLDDVVARSWQRSLHAGLSPIGRLDCTDNLSGTPLQRLRQHNHDLLSHSEPVMEYLFEQVRESQSMVILSDAQGVLMHTLGDLQFLTKAERVALMCGASWAENQRGTNAIGTALAEVHEVEIHGGEHYLERNGFLTCAASPILSAQGQLMGILDLSGDQRSRHPHTLGLVNTAARMIENSLLLASCRHQLLVQLHARAEGLGSVAQGLLAFGEDGWLVGANRQALQMLGLHTSDLGRTEWSQLFAEDWQQLLSVQQRHAHRPMAVHGHNGKLLHAQLHSQTQAQQKVTVAVRQQQDALQHLDSGDAQWSAAAGKARKVMDKGISLLVTGESGVGKELFAQAVHQCSRRADKPFVAVNCAAIPEHLIEAELFGYVPGAFTGASRHGANGRLRDADGGTLFLDEIGDMPLAMQTRLLRVLQERQVTPVGSSTPVPVDFALICATHQNLREAIDQGRFRTDLYYRINGLTLQLPALRERTDLQAICERMLQEFSPQAPVHLAPDVMDAMSAYAWPGNLRQLGHALRTAVALLEPHESQIQWIHLPDDLVQELQSPMLQSKTDAPAQNLEQLSRKAIAQALENARGNVSAAARQLGISRQTLYRKLQ